MWQTAIILFLIAAILVYVIRHYVRIARSGATVCSGCIGCSGSEGRVEKVQCTASAEGNQESEAGN